MTAASEASHPISTNRRIREVGGAMARSCSSAFRLDMSVSRGPSHISLSILTTVVRACDWPWANSGSFAGSVLLAFLIERLAAQPMPTKRVDPRFDGDGDIMHHGSGAGLFRPARPILSHDASAVACPARPTEIAVGTLSAGCGARAAVYPHVALVAGPFCDGPISKVYEDQHPERSAGHSIRDRPGCVFADLPRSGRGCVRDCCSEILRTSFVRRIRLRFWYAMW